jgi:3-oxoadipate enol-lactonase
MADAPRRIHGPPALVADVRGAGPPVVFLHGIGGHRGNWSRQLDALADVATCVAYDARGYGDSEDGDGPPTMADFRADLLRVLDACGAPRAHLVGLSMGGMVALDTALHSPDRVASLVLADTGVGPAQEFSAAELEEFLRLRRAPLLAGRTPAEIAPAVARSLVSPAAGAAVIAELEASLARLRPGPYLATLEAVTRYAGLTGLERIAAPTLVVVGADDTLTPPARARALAARISGARYAEIPRAGHLSNLEQPAAFCATLRGFLLPLLEDRPDAA